MVKLFSLPPKKLTKLYFYIVPEDLFEYNNMTLEDTRDFYANQKEYKNLKLTEEGSYFLAGLYEGNWFRVMVDYTLFEETSTVELVDEGLFCGLDELEADMSVVPHHNHTQKFLWFVVPQKQPPKNFCGSGTLPHICEIFFVVWYVVCGTTYNIVGN